MPSLPPAYTEVGYGAQGSEQLQQREGEALGVPNPASLTFFSRNLALAQVRDLDALLLDGGERLLQLLRPHAAGRGRARLAHPPAARRPAAAHRHRVRRAALLNEERVARAEAARGQRARTVRTNAVSGGPRRGGSATAVCATRATRVGRVVRGGWRRTGPPNFLNSFVRSRMLYVTGEPDFSRPGTTRRTRRAQRRIKLDGARHPYGRGPSST